VVKQVHQLKTKQHRQFIPNWPSWSSSPWEMLAHEGIFVSRSDEIVVHLGIFFVTEKLSGIPSFESHGISESPNDVILGNLKI